MDLNIDFNKENLTSLLQSWVRTYYNQEDIEGLNTMSLKVIDALNIKIDGIPICSQSNIEELQEAFSRYNKARIDVINNRFNEEYFGMDENELLRPQIQRVRGALNTCIAILRIP